ncbi:MAG: TRAP transporter large permease subunit [Alphaproteobacteria bacterium]|nr:TRAP transporter large permease subunit [Alphaproteobacteria bacterium]
MSDVGAAAQHDGQSRWMWPLEAVAAALTLLITVLLLGGVISRYVFGLPLVWSEEVVSISFIWLTMSGAAIALHRQEHLRLNLFVDLLPPRAKQWAVAMSQVLVTTLLLVLMRPAIEYAQDEWFIRTPALNLPNTVRVGSIALGLALMVLMVVNQALKTSKRMDLWVSALVVVALGWGGSQCSDFWWQLGLFNIPIFLIGLVAVCLVLGVPIAFCFGLGAACYLGFSTQVPLTVIIGRMDEGMSSVVLVSVPIFVFLGCVLDATGMGKAIVDFLASLIGHIKAGMSYVLLGSLFIVSGISGSKVSDMATVAPALFPEMKRRGNKPSEMVALLATGAAMADTVPPSIVLIVLGAVAGVSIAGLFQSGFVVAMVLLLALIVLARWKARHEDTSGSRRASRRDIWRYVVVAAPALVLPFLIRSAVAEGVATATEVSTVAVVYALIVGHFIYGGIGWRKFYGMLVETAALSGAVLLVLGAASAMAWSITQSGVVQHLSAFMTTLPGGWIGFMAVTIFIFLVLGCLLEGLPAVLLLAPIMFPIARKLGIHDIHYAMVIVCAMNVGLMMPPIGVGFYIACRIGGAKPDEVIGAIWPYLVALLVGVFIIAAFPWISTVAL